MASAEEQSDAALADHIETILLLEAQVKFLSGRCVGLHTRVRKVEREKIALLDKIEQLTPPEPPTDSTE